MQVGGSTNKESTLLPSWGLCCHVFELRATGRGVFERWGKPARSRRRMRRRTQRPTMGDVHIISLPSTCRLLNRHEEGVINQESIWHSMSFAWRDHLEDTCQFAAPGHSSRLGITRGGIIKSHPQQRCRPGMSMGSKNRLSWLLENHWTPHPKSVGKSLGPMITAIWVLSISWIQCQFHWALCWAADVTSRRFRACKCDSRV